MRYREIIEAVEKDDDMFSAPGNLATGAKQAIKQIEDPYLRTVRRVRELAKTGFGIKTRVSSVPKSASRGRATFWFGDYVTGPGGRAPKPLPVAQEIKAELEKQGFECKFTGSGWLSVLVPPTYSDLLREENDDELFGRPGGKFAGMTGQEVIDHWDELQQELYGYEAYWDDDNDPEFLQKENELKALMRYARIRFGEGFYQYLSKWGEHSDAQYARHRERSNADPFSNRRYREDPRVTKAGKLHKQDALGLRNDIKARVGTHRTPVLPESDDDELFGSAPSAATLTQSIARAIVRSDKSARLITSPFMVGFALGKTPGGEHLLHYWKSMGQEKQDAMLDGINDAVYDLIANKVTEDDDDDMFGSSTRPDSKVIAQDLELWLRRRQSSSRRPIIPSSEKYVQEVIAAFNRSFLNGIRVWSEYPLYGNTDIKYDIREYFEQTRSVNFMDYVDQVNENAESDDELFGDGEQKVFVVSAPDDEILGMFGDIREAIAHAKEQVPVYLEDGWGDDDFITVYKQRWNNDSGVPVAHFPITDDPIDESNDDDDLFASPTIRFGDFFNEYDEDELQALGFSYGDDPEQDVDIINHYLEDGPVNWRVLKLTDASGQGDDIVLHLDRSSRLG